MIKYYTCIISIIMMSLFCVTASAEPTIMGKKVVCDDKDTVFKIISEKFKEVPQWWGQTSQQNTQLVLMVNNTTSTWSLIEFNETIACIVSEGEKSSNRWGIPA